MRKTPEVESIINYLSARVAKCYADYEIVKNDRDTVAATISDPNLLNDHKRMYTNGMKILLYHGSEAKRILKWIESQIEQNNTNDICDSEPKENVWDESLPWWDENDT